MKEQIERTCLVHFFKPNYQAMKNLCKKLLWVSLLTMGIRALLAQNTADLVSAPMFTLEDLNGDSVSLADYEERFLLIHIATTWCPYCNAEAPYLEQLYQEYAEEEVGVIIIDVREPKELVAQKLKDQFALTFPVLLDDDGAVAASFAPPDVLPELARDEIMLASNILINSEGKIVFMSLLDTRNFDSKLIHIKEKLNELLQAN